jgi:hypothetical protein
VYRFLTRSWYRDHASFQGYQEGQGDFQPKELDLGGGWKYKLIGVAEWV